MTLSQRNKEIKCLMRLQELTNFSLQNIIDFLHQEKFISSDDARKLQNSAELAKELQLTLSRLQGDKLQLLEYSWAILPVERIKVMIVTDKTTQSFTYNE